MSVRQASYRRAGWLILRRSRGLRAGSVKLRRGQVMAWHSTRSREELLIAVQGRVCVEVLAGASRPRPRRVLLSTGECLWLSTDTRHRVVNTSRSMAQYLYVTGAA